MPLTESNIYTLKDLINALKNRSNNKPYSEILNKIQFGFKQIEQLCFWDKDNYSKISIDKNGFGELVLICWEKDQKSPIHNHTNNEAWTYILKGNLTEEIYTINDKDTVEKFISLKEKDFSSIKKESNKVHRLINSFDGRSVSLHLYNK